MSAVEQFEQIASQDRFKGWPLVGGYDTVAKIPFFGDAIHYQLQTGNGLEDYYSLIRNFGWSVAFGVTTENQVLTLVQWKPGVNKASWELPPGGIGKVGPEISAEELLQRTKDSYLKETGYGSERWDYLGNVLIETGKYRGAAPESHGLAAHMFLATGLEKMQDGRNPNPNEIMETLMVPIKEFDRVIDSGLFREASALPCALLALRKLKI